MTDELKKMIEQTAAAVKDELTAIKEREAGTLKAAQEASKNYFETLEKGKTQLEEKTAKAKEELAETKAKAEKIEKEINRMQSRGKIEEAAELDGQLSELEKKAGELERIIRLSRPELLTGEPEAYEAAQTADEAHKEQIKKSMAEAAEIRDIIKEFEKLRELAETIITPYGHGITRFDKVQANYIKTA